MTDTPTDDTRMAAIEWWATHPYAAATEIEMLQAQHRADAAEIERLTAERKELIDLLQAIYEALSDDR